MSLLSVAITLIVIGVLLWLAMRFIPMDGTIKKIIIAVVVICVIFYLLSITGLLGHANEVKVPHV